MEDLSEQPRGYYSLFVDLSVFADQYDVPQLRKDIMTVLVDLESQFHTNGMKTCTSLCASTLVGRLPDTAPIRRYIAQQVARIWQKNHSSRSFLDRFPRAFVTDILQAILSVPRSVLPAKALKPTRLRPCNYHEHRTTDDENACKEQQAADGSFYLGFLKACMREVAKIAEGHNQVQ